MAAFVRPMVIPMAALHMPAFVIMVPVASLATIVVAWCMLPAAALALQMAAAVEEKMLALVVLL